MLDDEEFTFAAVLGYYSWTFETSVGIEYMDLSATSLAIGAKVIDKAKPVGGRFLYLWGVANAITGETYDTVYGYETIDVSEAAFSLLEVKFTYAFSDAICALSGLPKRSTSSTSPPIRTWVTAGSGSDYRWRSSSRASVGDGQSPTSDRGWAQFVYMLSSLPPLPEGRRAYDGIFPVPFLDVVQGLVQAIELLFPVAVAK